MKTEEIEAIVKKEEEKKRKKEEKNREIAELNKDFIDEMIDLGLEKSVTVDQEWKNREEIKNKKLKEEFHSQLENLKNKNPQHNEKIRTTLSLNGKNTYGKSPFLVEKYSFIDKSVILFKYFFSITHFVDIHTEKGWLDHFSGHSSDFSFHHGDFSDEEEGFLTWIPDENLNLNIGNRQVTYKYIAYTDYLNYKRVKNKVLGEEYMTKEEKQIKALQTEIASLKEELSSKDKALNEEKEQCKKLEKEKDKLEKEIRTQLQNYPLESHLNTFIKRLKEINEDTIKGDKENNFLTLYRKLKELLQKTSNLPLEQREIILEDVIQINQVEAVIDLYGEKIKRVKQDDSLDEEEQAEKIEYWRRLREKKITSIMEE